MASVTITRVTPVRHRMCPRLRAIVDAKVKGGPSVVGVIISVRNGQATAQWPAGELSKANAQRIGAPYIAPTERHRVCHATAEAFAALHPELL